MEKRVGELIKEARESKDLSMRQLAKLAHVSHSDISRIESGEREIPNPKILRKISKYIGINYNDLMYAAGLGVKISPLNPYILEYYSSLQGEELRTTLNDTESKIKNNEILIESLNKTLELEEDEEKKAIIEDTIEELKYQNENNEDIRKLLESMALTEFKNGKSN